MSVLDELRKMVAEKFEGNGDGLLFLRGAKKDALDAIEAFEADHPGLVDRTRYCRDCALPVDLDYSGTMWAAFDPATKWRCPACAKEATE